MEQEQQEQREYEERAYEGSVVQEQMESIRIEEYESYQAAD